MVTCCAALPPLGLVNSGKHKSKFRVILFSALPCDVYVCRDAKQYIEGLCSFSMRLLSYREVTSNWAFCKTMFLRFFMELGGSLPPSVSVLNQIIPVYTVSSCFLVSILVLCFHLRLGFSGGPCVSGFATKNPTCFLPLPKDARCLSDYRNYFW
jgi:hypothetical protein